MALQTADCSIFTRHYPATIDGWQDVLFHQTDAGFTVVDAGIAATGTLIVRSSP
jgi:L-lactate utilization protein LutC